MGAIALGNRLFYFSQCLGFQIRLSNIGGAAQFFVASDFLRVLRCGRRFDICAICAGLRAGRFGFGFFRGACCGLISAGALLPSLRRERAAGALRLRKPSRARFACFPPRRENLRKIFAKKRFGARRPADFFARYLKSRRKALRRIAGLSRTGRAGIRAARNRLLIGAKDC